MFDKLKAALGIVKLQEGEVIDRHHFEPSLIVGSKNMSEESFELKIRGKNKDNKIVIEWIEVDSMDYYNTPTGSMYFFRRR